MKPRLPQVLLGALALGVAALAFADWLPLIHNLPVRDNPNDPSNPFLSRSQGITAPPPAPTPTITPTSVCGSPSDTSDLDGFESGTGTWACIPTSVAGYTYATVTAGTGSPGGTEVCAGAGSLCGTADYVHGGNAVKVGYQYLPPAAYDFSGETLSAMVYFPAAMGSASTPPSAKLFVKTGAGYTYYSGSAVNAPVSGGWVQLLLYMGAAYENGSGAAVAVAAPADVVAIGLDIYSPDGAPDGTFTVCMDVLDSSAAPTATVTPTSTPTETPGGAPPTATFTPTPVPTFTPGGPCGSPTDSSTYGFEAPGGISGWSSQVYAGYTSVTLSAGSTADSDVCDGAGSLCGELTTPAYTGGATDVAFTLGGLAGVDWTGMSLSGEAFFPPGLSGTTVQFVVKNTSGYTSYDGPVTDAPADGGWVAFSMTPAAGDENAVYEMDVQFNLSAGTPAGSYPLCVDSINVQ